MHAYEATLLVENPLSFRTNEYGNVIRTSRVLHNWALRFALNGIRGNPEKDHLENLVGQPIYSTPAVPEQVEFEFQTFHPFPEAPQSFRKPEKIKAGSLRTYQSKYTILHHKEFVRVGSTFRFAVASDKRLPSEMIITHGGKQTLQRVRLEEADTITKPAPFKGMIQHPVNPLDFPDRVRLEHCFEHTMPPCPLYEGTLVEPITARIIRKDNRQYVVPPKW